MTLSFYVFPMKKKRSLRFNFLKLRVAVHIHSSEIEKKKPQPNLHLNQYLFASNCSFFQFHIEIERLKNTPFFIFC